MVKRGFTVLLAASVWEPHCLRQRLRIKSQSQCQEAWQTGLRAHHTPWLGDSYTAFLGIASFIQHLDTQKKALLACRSGKGRLLIPLEFRLNAVCVFT